MLRAYEKTEGVKQVLEETRKFVSSRHGKLVPKSETVPNLVDLFTQHYNRDSIIIGKKNSEQLPKCGLYPRRKGRMRCLTLR